MLLTVCTIRQLPQALTLADSLRRHHPDPTAWPMVIGLADDPARLPAGFSWPDGLSRLTLTDCLPEPVVEVSARYTPNEFLAVVKPAFIREAMRRFAPAVGLIYADPSSYIYGSLDAMRARVAGKTMWLTPHLSQPPADSCRPDEKYLQNVGLYSAGWLVFGPGAETDRLLAWWEERSLAHGKVDFCAGTCANQRWLMHTPTLFAGVGCDRDPAVQVALWNLPERRLSQNVTKQWLVSGPDAVTRPLVSANFCGLLRPNEGYFQQQNRFQLRRRPDVRALLTDYRQTLSCFTDPLLTGIAPAYGDQPEPVVLTGWRRTADEQLRQAIRRVRAFGWPSRAVVPGH
jgi:hypothetical protein